MAATTRCGAPVAATPASVTTRTRWAPYRLTSNPISSAAPGPNLRFGPPKVKTVSAVTVAPFVGDFRQRREHRPDLVGDRDRPAGHRIDVDVHEPPHRGRPVPVRGEQRQAVHDAGIAKPLQADSGRHDIREA